MKTNIFFNRTKIDVFHNHECASDSCRSLPLYNLSIRSFLILTRFDGFVLGYVKICLLLLFYVIVLFLIDYGFIEKI
jgi:hypothetical protein